MRQKKSKALVVIFAILVCLLFVNVSTVYATEISDDLTNDVNEEHNDRFSKSSPWMEGVDESIYSNPIDATEEQEDIEPKDPGTVEKYLSELLRNASSSLISLLEDNLGVGIDRIIFGRVGSGNPDSVNIFGFELRSGNPYGVTASVCYSLLRSIIYVLLGVSFVFMLAKGAWTGNTAQSREQIKTNIFSVASKFVMLTMMPYLFDVVLYVRDVCLYGIKQLTAQMITGGATLSLSNAFLVNAERTGRFIDAVMYLGTVVLTLYFAFIYIAVAIDLLVCFIAFPIMCLLHSPKKDLLGNWLMNVLSDILTPVLDAILLLIPLLTSMMLSDVVEGIAVIQLIMCMLIIPSRNRIKALLGIQSNERGGIFGAMALLTLGRALTGKVRNAFNRASSIRSDMQNSKMHGEMAEVDKAEEESLLTGDSKEKNGLNEGNENNSNPGDNPQEGSQTGNEQEAGMQPNEDSEHSVSETGNAEALGQPEENEGLANGEGMSQEEEIANAADEKNIGIGQGIGAQKGAMGQGIKGMSSYDKARADIIAKRADINNFEQPEFKKHLTNAQMQSLYRKRAVTNAARGTASVAGAVAGGVFLGGASVFMPPSTVAMSTAAGAVVGSSIADGAVVTGMAGARAVGAVARKGQAVYQANAQMQVQRAVSAVDFNAAYQQSPIIPAAVTGQVDVVDTPQAVPVQMGVWEQAEADSTRVLQGMVSSSGNLQNSSAMRALQRANIETGKYVASVRDTQGVHLSQQEENEKRIELQTQFMTEEVLNKMSSSGAYEKGTAQYEAAQKIIRDKVRVIIEKKNKDTL